MNVLASLLVVLASEAVVASSAFPIVDFGARAGDELQTAAIQADDSGELYVRGGTEVRREPFKK
jgi:hypothetical protein